MQMFRTAPSETADGARLRRVKRAMALLALACLTALIYLAALVATMPASALSDLATMPRQVTAFYGTIWQGRADLIDGYRIDWDHRPGDLLGLRLAADATLQGPDTLLRGTVRVTPWTISARDVTGRAGPGLLALADGLAIAGCSTRAIVETFADPAPSIAAMRQREPILDEKIERERWNITAQYVGAADTRGHGLGDIRKLTLERQVDEVADVLGLKVKPASDAIFNTTMLPSRTERTLPKA